mmetsp:Transcript_21460/g.37391  ORF Transcript_21460/g.37391 Transcript_21460/m.37391 type:complete len:1116 (+) Transcript_21460:56-3403(+)
MPNETYATPQGQPGSMKMGEFQRELKLGEVESSYVQRFLLLDSSNKEKAAEIARLQAQLMALKQEQTKLVADETQSLLAQLSALEQEHTRLMTAQAEKIQAQQKSLTEEQVQLINLKQAEQSREIKLMEVEESYFKRFRDMDSSSKQKTVEIKLLTSELMTLKQQQAEAIATENERLQAQLLILQEEAERKAKAKGEFERELKLTHIEESYFIKYQGMQTSNKTMSQQIEILQAQLMQQKGQYTGMGAEALEASVVQELPWKVPYSSLTFATVEELKVRPGSADAKSNLLSGSARLGTYGGTIMHEAMYNKKFFILEYLALQNPDLLGMENNGYDHPLLGTPLQCAAYSNEVEMVPVLLKYMSKSQVDIASPDIAGPDGKTALQIAEERGNVQIAQLIAQGQVQTRALPVKGQYGAVAAYNQESAELAAIKQAEAKRESRLTDVETSYVLWFKELEASNKNKDVEIKDLKAQLQLMKSQAVREAVVGRSLSAQQAEGVETTGATRSLDAETTEEGDDGWSDNPASQFLAWLYSFFGSSDEDQKRLKEIEAQWKLKLKALEELQAKQVNELQTLSKQKTAENESLMAQLMALKQANSEYELKVNSDQAEKAVLLGTFHTQTQRITELEDEIQRERDMKAQAELAIQQQMNADLEARRHALEADHAIHVQRLHDAIASGDQRKAELEQQLMSQDEGRLAELQEANAVIAELKERIAELEIEIQREREIKSQDDATFRETMANDMEARHQALVDDHAKHVERLQGALAAGDQRSAELEKQILVQDEARLQELEEARNMIVDLQSLQVQHEQQMRDMASAHEQTRLQNEELLGQSQGDAQARIQEMDAQMQEMEAQIQELMQVNEQSKNQNDYLVATIEAERQNHGAQVQELENIIAELKAQLANSGPMETTSRGLEEVQTAPTPGELSLGPAVVVEKFTGDSMDAQALSLGVGVGVEILALDGIWATVKTTYGQTGDVPAMCLSQDEAIQTRALEMVVEEPAPSSPISPPQYVIESSPISPPQYVIEGQAYMQPRSEPQLVMQEPLLVQKYALPQTAPLQQVVYTNKLPASRVIQQQTTAYPMVTSAPRAAYPMTSALVPGGEVKYMMGPPSAGQIVY